jgi:cell division transport system ATP-binding protein
MGSMVVFSNVSKRYVGGIVALDSLSFSLEEGEFLFLTGPSGAGKTTVLRLMLAEERPTSGQIIVARRNLGALRESAIPFLRRNMGVIFQDFRLIESRTAFENIAVTLEVLALPQREIRTRVGQVMEVLGISRLADHRPPMLSGGEQQRVAIARAIVNDPPLIIADEPTGNLDPLLAVEVMNLLMDCHRRGTTLLVATHDLALMNRYRARCLGLERGVLVEETITGGDGEVA